MARVHHVKKAQKDNPAVKKGQPYYWWAFRYGGKHYSETFPRASALTQSAFLGGVYAVQEEAEDWKPVDPAKWREELKDAAESWGDQVRELGEECQSSRDGMPEGLQDGPTGTMLEERACGADEIADAIEAIDLDEEDDDDDEEATEPKTENEIDHEWQMARDEIVTAISYEGE